ncbi:MAG: 50S ribosomal protein L15 [Acidobacteriota bacterium]|nr:50S ribosomal protein L15 [Acidobacteriota bacterium]
MPLHIGTINRPAGAHKRPKRIGFGMGSGHGKTATRGSKGQKSRSGSSIRPGFEGGQMPLQRRLPKRGFTNIFKKRYAIVNLGDLEVFSPGEEVTPEALWNRGMVKKLGDGLKVLGEGDLKAPLTISAHLFSKPALEKIKRAGGKAQVLSA